VIRKLAFVLCGGGARGALQVGALRALLEKNICPDLLVGTSVGAVNAAFLAVNGVNLTGIENLVNAWHDALLTNLLPPNLLWLTIRAVFNRQTVYYSHRMRGFYQAHGLAPSLRFGDIEGVKLYIVAADLNQASTVVFGFDPQGSVLDAVLASSALPPWISPLAKDGHLLIDGGAVSTLPIEPALQAGATEIIALDLVDPRNYSPDTQGFGPFISKMINTVARRQTELELKLAISRDVPVRRILLRGVQPVELWDFGHTDELIERGYEITRQDIDCWEAVKEPRWLSWLKA